MLSKVEISHRTIIFIAVFLAVVWFLLQIREILFLLFISFIIMSALRPMVDWLEGKRIPRILSILILYIILIAVVGVSLIFTIPSIVTQLIHLFQVLPSFVARIVPNWNIDINAFTQQIAPLSENIVKITVGIFSNVITLVTVLVFTFYLLVERKHTETMIAGFVGEEMSKRIVRVLLKVERRLGSWMQGQLFLMITIGVLSYVGLTFLHIDFALPLALLAGLMEIVPTIGPIVSGIPAVIIALSTSPLMAISVVALYFVIHQSENTIVVPFVMKKSVGLSPLVTILSLMIGGKLAGIAGVILAVPVVLVVQEILQEVTSKNT